MKEKSKNKWIVHEVEQEGAKINFFGFPYAGGSPSMFAPWKADMPKTVNFYPVLYPMRELRKNEPLPESVDILVREFVEESIDLFRTDFILFGHCTGTLIAYKVLLEVRRRLGREPLCLIASGSESPYFIMAREREMGKEMLQDVALLERMIQYELVEKETALNPIFSKYYLPLYKGDLSMLSTYEYTKQDPLYCDVHVISGSEDLTLRKEAWEDWSSFAGGKIIFRTFQGKHFYFAKDKQPIIQYLQKVIEEKHYDNKKI